MGLEIINLKSLISVELIDRGKGGPFDDEEQITN